MFIGAEYFHKTYNINLEKNIYKKKRPDQTRLDCCRTVWSGLI